MPRGDTPRSGRVADFDGRRNVLPRTGRPAPPWPLPGTPSPRESDLWALEWSRPQSHIWERDLLANDVALYVRKRAEAETPGSSSASVDALRRLADDLLLTIPAMRRAGITIADPDDGPTRPTTPPTRHTGRRAQASRMAALGIHVVQPPAAS